MFDEFKNVNFSRTYIDVSEVVLELDLSQLENDIINILLSYDLPFGFCEEEYAEAGLSFDCWDSTVDKDSMAEYTVGEVNLTVHDPDNEIGGDDLSFEFTYPRKITYEELLYAFELLLRNIFMVIESEQSG